jgi:hypothetical protein
MVSETPTQPASSVPAESIEELLGTLCVTYGFCLRSPYYDQLCDSPPGTAQAFLDAVFRAEGLDPHTADSKLYEPMLEVVRSVFDQRA